MWALLRKWQFWILALVVFLAIDAMTHFIPI